MRIYHPERASPKGWHVGPWNSDLTISVGYANAGIDQPHYHTRITEIYLVAGGQAQARIEQDVITLSAGDVLVVEPGETHTFLASTPDYFHFVVHCPGLAGQAARDEKTLVDQD